MIDRSRPCRPSSPHRDRLPEMAILVNSSDGFQDCWAPFFRLLATHWPSCRFPVYLNVEEATYEHPSLEVRCLNHPRLPSGAMVPWSDRLIESLQAIPEPYVMSMQEDYFLDAPVRAELVEDCLRGVADDGVGCVRLTGFGARGGTKMAERPYLVDVPRISHSRTSTQAAIWDKEVLLSYVRRQETVWETEILGTRRAWSRYAAIRTVDRDRLEGRPIVSYTGTGIIRGKWHPELVPLFARPGIPMDFERRGFHALPSRWTTRSRMIASVVRRPGRFLAAILGAAS
ncbi:MAG: hypothetical protein FJ284_15835 [Planctomycetes bacterium]|nr:hypothetical protein [Planctomycetota bacterium]